MTSKLGSENEREAMLLNLPPASPLTEAAGTPLASGTGPRGLGFNFLRVELHTPRRGSQQRQNKSGAITGTMASPYSDLWMALEGVLLSLLLGPSQRLSL